MFGLFLLLYIVILWRPVFKKNKDWFSPPVMFAITMSFYTLPDLFDILINGMANYAGTLPFKLNDPNYAIIRFIILQVVFILMYQYAFSKSTKSLNEEVNNSVKLQTSKIDLFVSIALLSICVIATVNFVTSYGGISTILSSFTNRSQLHDDMPFILRITPALLTFASAFLLRLICTDTKHHYFLLLMLFFSGFITTTIGGGRSQFVVFILELLCYYNYWKKPINLLSIKLWPIYLGLAAFIAIFQLLRLNDITTLSFNSMVGDSDSLFNSMAYVKTQLLIQSYFENNDFWYGKIFLFVIYIFIPRAIFPAKPNIDEGVYIYNMTFGGKNLLSDHATSFNSWPPFSIGEGYANFGILGVILFGILLGYIHGFAYKKMKQNRFDVFVMIVYVFIILKFQITLFYLANLAYLLVEVFMFSQLYKLIKR